MNEDEREAASIIASPLHAIVLNEEAFKPHKHASAKEDWVLLNAALIDDIGIVTWLNELLDVLSLPTKDYDGHEIINPLLAISIPEALKNNDALTITRKQWIEANEKLIKEIGNAEWLWLLPTVLEAKSPTSD